MASPLSAVEFGEGERLILAPSLRTLTEQGTHPVGVVNGLVRPLFLDLQLSGVPFRLAPGASRVEDSAEDFLQLRTHLLSHLQPSHPLADPHYDLHADDWASRPSLLHFPSKQTPPTWARLLSAGPKRRVRETQSRLPHLAASAPAAFFPLLAGLCPNGRPAARTEGRQGRASKAWEWVGCTGFTATTLSARSQYCSKER